MCLNIYSSVISISTIPTIFPVEIRDFFPPSRFSRFFSNIGSFANFIGRRAKVWTAENSRGNESSFPTSVCTIPRALKSRWMELYTNDRYETRDFNDPRAKSKSGRTEFVVVNIEMFSLSLSLFHLKKKRKKEKTSPARHLSFFSFFAFGLTKELRDRRHSLLRVVL